jgi:hypothetical protein
MRTISGAVLSMLLVSSSASGQSWVLQGSVGPTITDSGHSLAVGIGASLSSRLSLLIDLERTHLFSRFTSDGRGGGSAFRGERSPLRLRSCARRYSVAIACRLICSADTASAYRGQTSTRSSRTSSPTTHAWCSSVAVFMCRCASGSACSAMSGWSLALKATKGYSPLRRCAWVWPGASETPRLRLLEDESLRPAVCP